MSTVSSPSPRSAGWLKGRTFDLAFIVGLTSLALLTGLFVVLNPSVFLVVFVINGWLLGYHHVTSTYTRLAFDRDSLRENRFLLTWLPFIVLGSVIAASLVFGPWILTTIYLYWQWWHYTRQSYGVSRIYSRKAGATPDRLTTAVVYAIPVWGILYRSYQGPESFLFSSVKVLPVPLWLVWVVGAGALALTGLWFVRQITARTLATPHTLYMASHLAIFSTGYLLIDNINHGWLVLNVWHNTQYILVVWMFNNNRFKNGVDQRHKFLSRLSQRQNVVQYFAVCLIISTVAYSLLDFALTSAASLFAITLPIFAIAYQAINFHHYVVDAVIWKVRRKPIRENFGIVDPQRRKGARSFQGADAF